MASMTALLVLALICVAWAHVDLSKLTSYSVQHVAAPAAHFPFHLADANPKDAYWAHPRTSSLRFDLDGTPVTVDLQRDNSLFSGDYHETARDYDGPRLLAERRHARTVKDRACVYRGYHTVDGRPASAERSFVMTCEGGFDGTLFVQSGGISQIVVVEPASRHFTPAQMQTHLVAAQSRHAFQAQVAHQPDYRGEAPISLGSLHVVYKLSDFQIDNNGEVSWCGGYANPNHDSAQTEAFNAGAHMAHITQLLSTVTAQAAAVPAAEHKSAKGPSFKTQAVEQIVELCVVNDFERIEALNSAGRDTAAEAVSITGVVSALYANSFAGRDPIVKVVLVSQYLFARGDPYAKVPYDAFSVNVASLLSSFHQWANGPNTNLTHHDNRQLYSGFDFQASVLGYAGVGTMCQPSASGGIDQTVVGPYSFATYGAVVAHEMGHNFGMLHDSDMNACAASGFIMNALVNTNVPPTNFSSCSFVYYTSFVTNNPVSCLNDIPTVVYGDAQCGNNFVEAGEECDCGFQGPGACDAIDPCCNGLNCMLKVTSQCSNAQPCCAGCQIVQNNQTCRASTGICDIAEVCNGQSAACPVDVVIGAGNACNDVTFGPGQCYFGQCSSLQRDCRIKGNTFSSPAPPYDACSDPDPSSGDSFCNAMQCKPTSGSQCLTFTTGGADAFSIQVANGVPCGNGRQCLDGQCTLSNSFDSKHVWVRESYDPCFSCDVPQTAPVHCWTSTNNLQRVQVPDLVCSPVGKPSVSRPCQNGSAVPPLSCIAAPNDNDLDRWARDLATRYGALDKAKAIRDAVPRWPGYPSEFSTTDPEYRRGIELMSVVPFIIAGVALMVWVAWCCCLKEKADGKAELSVPNGGYTKFQKYFPLFLALVFAVIMCIFAALALFWNGELRRGCCESSTGANVKMNQIIAGALALANQLRPYVDYLNASAAGDVGAARLAMVPVATALAGGVSGLTDSLTQLGATYSNYQQVSGPFGGTVPQQTYACTWCDGLALQIAAANAEINAMAAGVAALSTNAAAESVALNGIQLALWDGDLALIEDAARQVDKVQEKAAEKQDLVASATDKADMADRVFHPFCILFMAFVFVILLIVVIGGTCFKKNAENTFGYSVQLNFCMLFGGMMLLAFAIPLMAATGDSCEYLNKAEGDIAGTLNVSATAAHILESCLLDTDMSDALNLTDTLTLMATALDFPAPAASVNFNTPNLDRLLTNVSQPTFTAPFVFPTWNPNLVDDECEQVTSITVGIDGTFWRRNNITLMDTSSPPYNSPAALVDLQAAAVAHLRMEAQFYRLVSDLRANVTAVKQRLLALANATTSYRQIGVGSSSDLNLLHNAAQSLLESDSCGTLGQDYQDFKTAWCDVMTTSFSFLALSFFFIPVCAVPLLYLSRKLAWRLPVEGKISAVSELEVVDSRY